MTTPISPLNEFPPIVGDDLGFNAPHLRDMPEGYHFASLRTPDSVAYPKTFETWLQLCDIAERHYSDHEIVGVTIRDWFDHLQLAYDEQADTLERLLEVYNDDIAKPILGRTETVTYDVHDTNDATYEATKGSGTRTQAIDNPTVGATNETPTSIVDSEGRGTDTTTDNRSGSRTGSVKTELSDLGVRPNYESLNGFLDQNRTAAKVFIDMFGKCFTLAEYIAW